MVHWINYYTWTWSYAEASHSIYQGILKNSRQYTYYKEICPCFPSIHKFTLLPPWIICVRSTSYLGLESEVKVKVTHSCPTLWDPIDYTVHGILQVRILEWVAFPFSSRFSWPRNQTGVSCIAGGFFTNWAKTNVYWHGSCTVN